MRPKPSWAMTKAWVSFLCSNISLPRALPHYFRGQHFHIRGRCRTTFSFPGCFRAALPNNKFRLGLALFASAGLPRFGFSLQDILTSNLRWNEYMEVLAVAQQGLSKHNYYCLCLKLEASKPCKPNKAHGWVDFSSPPARWGSPDLNEDDTRQFGELASSLGFAGPESYARQ